MIWLLIQLRRIFGWDWSLSLCSGGLSIARRLRLRWLSLWACRWSIRIPVKVYFWLSFISLLLLFLNFGIDIAHAQTPEPPTPTYWSPFFVTSTPRPPNSYACTSGLPDGWGVRTPDPYWLSNCYSCLAALTPSPTVGPTVTPMLWQVTPTPNGGVTVTATITPTSTALPTVEPINPGLRLRCVSGGCAGQEGRSITLSGGTSNFVGDCSAGGNGLSVQVLDGSGSTYSYARVWYEGVANLTRTTDYNMPPVSPELHMTDQALLSGSSCTGSGVSSCSVSVAGAVSDVTTSGVEIYAGIGGCASLTAYRWDSWSYTISLDDLAVPPTPTPTGTPVPVNSVCGSVPLPPSPEDAIMSFPVPLVGVKVCPVEIPAINGATSGLGWIPGMGGIIESINFPGFRMCFRPVMLGVLRMFGIQVDLDILALLMSATTMFRVLSRRS